jgi:hypothetical protein
VTIKFPRGTFPLRRKAGSQSCAAATPVVLAVLLASGLARAAEPAAADPAAQLVGLFIQGCLPFAGDPAALRAWAGRNALPELPDQATKAFLHGAPGRSFDASAPGAKLVLASSDDGICSAVTDHAPTAAVTQSLESGLTRAGVAFRLAIDRDDTNAKTLHYREYLATRNGRSWRILAATVNDPGGGQAMLTAAPQ